MPLIALVVAPTALATATVIVSAITALVILGMAGAKASAPLGRAALRVGVGGTLAVAVTAGVGHLFGAATG